jgi:aminoglycoside phosphotransferase (APT) family kinase protein
VTPMSSPQHATNLVTESLATWLTEHTGVQVADVVVTGSNSTGFDSDIHFAHLVGDDLPAEWAGELVLRVKSEARFVEDAEREAAVHGWLLERGFPVPRILVVVEPGIGAVGPIQVMQRAPGVSMLDAATRRPWRVTDLLDRLAALQQRLHLLPLESCPTDLDVVERRLRLPRRVADAQGHAGLRDGIARMEALSDRFREAPLSLCHGDFHPLNALVDGTSVTIIDWTDAGLGDRHCDIARTVALFDLAPIVASSEVERRVLGVVGPRLGASYRRRYDAGLAIEPERLALWTPLHLLHDWSQALAGSSRDAAMPAAMADALGRRFELALDAVPPG